jgi:hypothetical protein
MARRSARDGINGGGLYGGNLPTSVCLSLTGREGPSALPSESDDFTLPSGRFFFL